MTIYLKGIAWTVILLGMTGCLAQRHSAMIIETGSNTALPSGLYKDVRVDGHLLLSEVGQKYIFQDMDVAGSLVIDSNTDTTFQNVEVRGEMILMPNVVTKLDNLTIQGSFVVQENSDCYMKELTLDHGDLMLYKNTNIIFN